MYGVKFYTIVENVCKCSTITTTTTTLTGISRVIRKFITSKWNNFTTGYRKELLNSVAY